MDEKKYTLKEFIRLDNAANHTIRITDGNLVSEEGKEWQMGDSLHILGLGVKFYLTQNDLTGRNFSSNFANTFYIDQRETLQLNKDDEGKLYMATQDIFCFDNNDCAHKLECNKIVQLLHKTNNIMCFAETNRNLYCPEKMLDKCFKKVFTVRPCQLLKASACNSNLHFHNQEHQFLFEKMTGLSHIPASVCMKLALCVLESHKFPAPMFFKSPVSCISETNCINVTSADLEKIKINIMGTYNGKIPSGIFSVPNGCDSNGYSQFLCVCTYSALSSKAKRESIQKTPNEAAESNEYGFQEKQEGPTFVDNRQEKNVPHKHTDRSPECKSGASYIDMNCSLNQEEEYVQITPPSNSLYYYMEIPQEETVQKMNVFPISRQIEEANCIHGQENVIVCSSQDQIAKRDLFLTDTENNPDSFGFQGKEQKQNDNEFQIKQEDINIKQTESIFVNLKIILDILHPRNKCKYKKLDNIQEKIKKAQSKAIESDIPPTKELPFFYENTTSNNNLFEIKICATESLSTFNDTTDEKCLQQCSEYLDQHAGGIKDKIQTCKDFKGIVQTLTLDTDGNHNQSGSETNHENHNAVTENLILTDQNPTKISVERNFSNEHNIVSMNRNSQKLNDIQNLQSKQEDKYNQPTDFDCMNLKIVLDIVHPVNGCNNISGLVQRQKEKSELEEKDSDNLTTQLPLFLKKTNKTDSFEINICATESLSTTQNIDDQNIYDANKCMPQCSEYLDQYVWDKKDEMPTYKDCKDSVHTLMHKNDVTHNQPSSRANHANPSHVPEKSFITNPYPTQSDYEDVSTTDKESKENKNNQDLHTKQRGAKNHRSEQEYVNLKIVLDVVHPLNNCKTFILDTDREKNETSVQEVKINENLNTNQLSVPVRQYNNKAPLFLLKCVQRSHHLIYLMQVTRI